MDELTGPLQDVFKDLRQKWKEMQEEPPFLDVVKGFVAAIDWNEPFIQALVVLHVINILTALLTRKHTTVQGCIFMISASTVFMAEQLNTLGAKHWEKISNQDYFDPRGVFFCTLISGPLVLVMFIVLINYLVSCSALLVQAKRKELLYKAKVRAEGTPTGEGKIEGKASRSVEKKRQ